MKKELDMTLEKEILHTEVPEFPIVRRMALGMISPLVVKSLDARAAVEKQQRSSPMAGIPCLSDIQQQFVSTRATSR